MRFDTARFDREQLPALLGQVLSGEPMGPDLGYSLEAQEAMYALAYILYSQRRFEDAMRLFCLLVMCDHLDRRYHMGMGACLQVQGQHAQAIRSYGAAANLDMTDPAPFMHVAECHLAVGDRRLARVALDYALVQARAHERHRSHVPRLEAMTALLDADRPKADTTPTPQEGG